MFTLEPLVWYDPNRISTKALYEAMEAKAGTWIPVEGDPSLAVGTVSQRYPTPDELYRWQPQEKK